jgi:hypothetical protein
MYGNPATAARDRLRELLGPRPEAYAQAATVSTKPRPGADGTRPTPYVRVEALGGALVRGIRTADRVRLTVHADDEGIAHDLAELVRGLLYASGGYLTPARPSLGLNTDTGEHLASLTVLALGAPR